MKNFAFRWVLVGVMGFVFAGDVQGGSLGMWSGSVPVILVVKRAQPPKGGKGSTPPRVLKKGGVGTAPRRK